MVYRLTAVMVLVASSALAQNLPYMCGDVTTPAQCQEMAFSALTDYPTPCSPGYCVKGILGDQYDCVPCGGGESGSLCRLAFLTAMTMTEVCCWSDQATGVTVNLQYDNTTPADILVSDLDCPLVAVSGGAGCTSTFVGTLDDVPQGARIEALVQSNTSGATWARVWVRWCAVDSYC